MIYTNSEKTKTWTNLDVLTKSIDMNNSEAKNIKTYQKKNNYFAWTSFFKSLVFVPAL